MCDKNTINTINNLGKEKIPFLFIIGFDPSHSIVVPLSEASGEDIEYDIRGNTNAGTETGTSSTVCFEKFPVPYNEYLSVFQEAKKNINLGNSYLLNLTFPTSVETNLNLRDIFRLSKASYKLRYKDLFVVFSPEPFVRISDNRIISFPMKGTRDATEAEASAKLLSDPKELAEHHTIVDLIRNDLSMVAENVRVNRFRYLEEIKTHEKRLLQTSSEICGDLQPGWQSRLGDILFALLPAGSVTGAPKAKTVEIIRQIETYERGFFTGIFGIYQGEQVESAVMIRFIENNNGRMVFKSGGGVTCFSDPLSEYREMVDKVYLPIA